MTRPRRILTALSALCLLALGRPLSAESTSARLYLQETGVYRLSFEDLKDSGYLTEPVPSAELSLHFAGESVPLWLEDGGDGSFDSGDSFEFIGQRLHGSDKHFFEHSRHNVYWLHLDAASADRMHPIAPAIDSSPVRRTLWREQHLEEDRLMIRLSAPEMREDENSDLWFWAKLSHIDKEPFAVELDLSDRAQSAQPIAFKVQLRGLSQVNQRLEGVSHHRVEAYLDGEFLAYAEWDGRTIAHLEVDVPSAKLGAEAPHMKRPRLELRIPKRSITEEDETLVDVVMLDWIKLRYAHAGTAPVDQVEIELVEAEEGPVELDTDHALLAYDSNGGRFQADAENGSLLSVPAATSKLFVVNQGRFRRLDRIEIDRPSRLKDRDQQSDYLMIAHAHLLAAAQPLADLHRRRGLAVDLIDVQDIYDEFNHGIVDPSAIRDFIGHAYHQWEEPKPRFVLLVGDASWDIHNDVADDANYANWTDRQLLHGERFPARKMTSYANQSSLQHRNLIPTWIYASRHGHSASDNGFVAVDGDDFYPDLAIGRFPVTEPEEVAAIVEKTIRYLEQPEVGPWRRNVLWITNENVSFQRTSDRMAAVLNQRGFKAEKIYPQPSEANNELHQATLQEAFNQGQLLVHFFGHGGRHIWRTGPPDFKKNHDLFTLEHVDELAPSDRLPVILSMTCYSAPFDHPSADSIGEKFLRVPDRGAVAVLAASWRNSPSRRFSNALIEELTSSGTAIGTAIQRAKIVSQNQVMVEMYNLLGDPAVELSLPAMEVDVEPHFTKGKVRVQASLVASDFTGTALVDGLDKEGNIVLKRQAKVIDGRLRSKLPLKNIAADQLATIRVYVWDETSGTDAFGVWRRPEELAADETQRRRASASERR